MAVDREELVVIVLSADQQRARRLESILETEPQLSVRTLCDPGELMEVLQPIRNCMYVGRKDYICGLVLDLTTSNVGASLNASGSVDASGHLPSWSQEGVSVSLSAIAALAAMSMLLQLPLVVSSVNDGFAQVFRRTGSPLVEVVPPSADDVVWHAVAVRMIAMSRQLRQPRRTTEVPETSILQLPTQLSANSQVWIDLERCQLTSARGTVPLTGQEGRVLEVLLRMPGRFHSAVELAEHVGSLVDQHCIQQTISGLRKKLGECARTPKVLVSRRGLGYALALPKPVKRYSETVYLSS